MKRTMNYAMAWIIQAEGGYVNHPDDPGGETKFGISKRSYPDLDIKNLTTSDAEQIYIRDYWMPIQGDQMPYPMDICVFDFAVNAGVSMAVKTLQRLIGVAADGIVGSVTLSKLADTDIQALYENYMWARLVFYANRKTASLFLHGWINRLFSLRNYILLYYSELEAK